MKKNILTCFLCYEEKYLVFCSFWALDIFLKSQISVKRRKCIYKTVHIFSYEIYFTFLEAHGIRNINLSNFFFRLPFFLYSSWVKRGIRSRIMEENPPLFSWQLCLIHIIPGKLKKLRIIEYTKGNEATGTMQLYFMKAGGEWECTFNEYPNDVGGWFW